jgi:hypothetical protein
MGMGSWLTRSKFAFLPCMCPAYGTSNCEDLLVGNSHRERPSISWHSWRSRLFCCEYVASSAALSSENHFLPLKNAVKSSIRMCISAVIFRTRSVSTLGRCATSGWKSVQFCSRPAGTKGEHARLPRAEEILTEIDQRWPT